MVMKKSGDSRLQDAEQARKEDTATAADPMSVYRQVEDAAEQARLAGADRERIAELEANLERLLKIVENMSADAAKQKVVTAKQAQVIVGSPPTPVICSACNQRLSVCNGTHARMNVMPDNPENLQFFQGVRWNGMQYYGPCIVPLVAAHDIACAVRNWEYGERVLHFGRSKVMDQMRRGMTMGLIWDKTLPIE